MQHSVVINFAYEVVGHHMEDSDTKTIKIFAGKSTDGHAVYEELPVKKISQDKYLLLSSPGIVLGLARGDEIIFEISSGKFRLTARGGNICLQLYVTQHMTTEVDKLITLVEKNLNGTLDGKTNKQVVFTIPFASGFTSIESLINCFIEANPGTEWYYGNVYDETDGITPLNWWLDA